MAILSNPIDNDNIISRFEDYVRTSANSGIVWHSGNIPFPEFPTAGLGPSTGKVQEISGANLTAPISASQIFSVLLAETRRYTRVRYVRAIKNITGAGKGAGGYSGETEPLDPGIVYDNTQKTSLISSYQINVNATQLINAGQAINAGTLESQLDAFRNAYFVGRDTIQTISVEVCHSSCHQSCHGSRSRR